MIKAVAALRAACEAGADCAGRAWIITVPRPIRLQVVRLSLECATPELLMTSVLGRMKRIRQLLLALHLLQHQCWRTNCAQFVYS